MSDSIEISVGEVGEMTDPETFWIFSSEIKTSLMVSNRQDFLPIFYLRRVINFLVLFIYLFVLATLWIKISDS